MCYDLAATRLGRRAAAKGTCSLGELCYLVHHASEEVAPWNMRAVLTCSLTTHVHDVSTWPSWSAVAAADQRMIAGSAERSTPPGITRKTRAHRVSSEA